MLQVGAAESCMVLYLRQLHAAIQAVIPRPELLLSMRCCSAPDVCVLAQSDLCGAIWCLCKPAVKAPEPKHPVHYSNCLKCIPFLLQEGQTLHLTS